MKGNYGGIHAKQNNGVKTERKSRQAVQQQNQVHFGAGVEKHTESPKVAPIAQIAQYGSSDWLNSINLLEPAFSVPGNETNMPGTARKKQYIPAYAKMDLGGTSVVNGEDNTLLPSMETGNSNLQNSFWKKFPDFSKRETSAEKRLHQEMQEYITNFTKTEDEYEKYIQEKAQNESNEQKIQQENAEKLSNYELMEKQKLSDIEKDEVYKRYGIFNENKENQEIIELLNQWEEKQNNLQQEATDNLPTIKEFDTRFAEIDPQKLNEARAVRENYKKLDVPYLFGERVFNRGIAEVEKKISGGLMAKDLYLQHLKDSDVNYENEDLQNALKEKENVVAQMQEMENFGLAYQLDEQGRISGYKPRYQELLNQKSGLEAVINYTKQATPLSKQSEGYQLLKEANARKEKTDWGLNDEQKFYKHAAEFLADIVVMKKLEKILPAAVVNFLGREDSIGQKISDEMPAGEALKREGLHYLGDYALSMADAEKIGTALGIDGLKSFGENFTDAVMEDGHKNQLFYMDRVLNEMTKDVFYAFAEKEIDDAMSNLVKAQKSMPMKENLYSLSVKEGKGVDTENQANLIIRDEKNTQEYALSRAEALKRASNMPENKGLKFDYTLMDEDAQKTANAIVRSAEQDGCHVLFVENDSSNGRIGIDGNIYINSGLSAESAAKTYAANEMVMQMYNDGSYEDLVDFIEEDASKKEWLEKKSNDLMDMHQINRPLETFSDYAKYIEHKHTKNGLIVSYRNAMQEAVAEWCSENLFGRKLNDEYAAKDSEIALIIELCKQKPQAAPYISKILNQKLWK